jgi:hypothetical protein
MFQVFALTVLIVAVAALTLVVIVVTRAVLDRLDRRDEQRHRRREERHSVPEGPDAWRQWAAYYRSLAEQARAEGNADSATIYDSLAETYSLLTGAASQNAARGQGGLTADTSVPTGSSRSISMPTP